MNSVLLALILIVVISMAIAQFAFIFWAMRKAQQNRRPLSVEHYNFACKVIASVLFAIGAMTALYSAWILTTGIKTTGVVTEIRRKRAEDGDELFAPTFRFVDSLGATNFVASNTYSSPVPYYVGQTVPVVYCSSDPSGARINRFAENWLSPIVLTILGSLTLVSIPIFKKWRELRPAQTLANQSSAAQ